MITGCLTKIPELMEWYKNEPSVHIVKNPDFVIPILNFIDNDNKRNTTKTKLASRTRLFYDNATHIQFFLCNGCLNNCSFCKTNYLDEPLTSIPYEIALKHLQNMIKRGTKSITLSGENLTLYGIDLYKKPILHKFIHDLSETPGLMYLTINEITAKNMYPELLQELITNKKVVSVGIQLETADNRLLNLMNRGHNLEQFDAIIRPLKEAGKYVNTVLLSGFPTETYEDIDTTINYIRNRGIATELICKYSDFDFIPSHDLPQLNKREKIRHCIYLREAIRKINYTVLDEKINDSKNAIIYGKEDNTIYLKCFHHGYSIKKEHQDLEIGDIIPTPAKCLVKEKKRNMRYQYRY
ncbi:MAG: radical SAM protein [Bacilli bacterium]|nr:radical SAM protein [Bacilli bacterium]